VPEKAREIYDVRRESERQLLKKNALREERLLRKYCLALNTTPVPINGNRMKGKKLGYFQKRLRDGTLGFHTRRTDDCFQAAVASCLQVQPHLVPDLRIIDELAGGKDPEQVQQEGWQKMSLWAETQGARLVVHPLPPVTARRWIGVSFDLAMFQGHCLVMSKRDALFDPMDLPISGGGFNAPTAVDQLDYGITFEKE